MGNEAVIHQTHDALVTLLKKASIGARMVRPVLKEDSFIGIEFPYTSKNWPIRIGFLPRDLDHLSIITEDAEANAIAGKRLVPSIDRTLRESIPDTRYTGKKDGSKYEKPYSWSLPITDLYRIYDDSR